MSYFKISAAFLISFFLLSLSCKSSGVKRINIYKIDPSDEKGSLLETRFFNEKGQVIKIFSYDYYGSGEIEDSTTFAYNAQGQKVQEIAYGSQTTTTYSYDEQGRLSEESWSRPNGQGASSKNRYNASGDLVETQHFDAAGVYDFSRIYELGYDRKGRVIKEQKWEKYSDGSEDLMLYHVGYTYNSVDSLMVKEYYSDNGVAGSRTEYTYDEQGRLTMELEISDIGLKEEERQKTVYHYNKAGQEVKSENFSIYEGKESLNYTHTYRYDKYGHQVWMMYEHADGNDAWGERRVYEFY